MITDAFEVLQLPRTATKDEIRNAYRKLARRWHPDRFLEGPEREWANEKMAEINAAYRQCLNGPANTKTGQDEHELLEQARKLIQDGKYKRARQSLMCAVSRCAEWNYLFGLVLLNLRETEKARIYLGIAMHQEPENLLYARAYERLTTVEPKGLLTRLFGKKVR